MRLALEKDVVGQIAMTRSERLVRWAELIRSSRWPTLKIFHLVEKWNAENLSTPFYMFYLGPDNAFAIAMGDKVFNVQGLPEMGSVWDVMTFFSLSLKELHTFSCNCGGEITKATMANRIEKLAA
jgi:hypothetical protein